MLSKRMTMWTLAMSTCLSVSTCVQAKSAMPQAVEKIDVQKYAGTWYEIAHLPMYFQRNCVSDIQANYVVNADQTITVRNSCRAGDNSLIRSEAVAYPQNTGNSQLKVSFMPKVLRWLPFTKGHYWVLRIDPEYKLALVGGPSHQYLWILARDTELDEATYQSYLQTAKSYGYDVSKLIKMPHQL